MLVFFCAQPSVHCSDVIPCYKRRGLEEKKIEKAICGSFIYCCFYLLFYLLLFFFSLKKSLRENVYEADFFFGRFDEFF